MNFDLFAENSTMAFLNKSLRPVEQYWNAMMQWKNIWFAFIKFVTFIKEGQDFSRLYICVMYCHFVLDLPSPPSALCYLTGLFVLLSVLGVLRPSVTVRMFSLVYQWIASLGWLLYWGHFSEIYPSLLFCAIALLRNIVYKWGRCYPFLFVSC